MNPFRFVTGWGSERLDLDAYLARIGFHGSLSPTPCNLFELHRRHMNSVVFENIDIVCRTPVSIDVEAIQDKIVRRGRGGYCYESNLLYLAALERFGFSPVRLLARVREGSTAVRPRTHTTALAYADDRWWLTDPGYGYAGTVEPIELVNGARQSIGDWSWTLRWDLRDLHWHLYDRTGECTWRDLYMFRIEPQSVADYEAAHYFSSTRDSSPFVKHLVIQQGGAKVRQTLRDRSLTTFWHPEKFDTRAELSNDEVTDAIRNLFSIDLDRTSEIALRAWLSRRWASTC